MSIVQLSSVKIPDETGLTRHKPDRCEILSPTFWDNYDSSTLFYDAVFDPIRKRLRVYAPRLWGLESAVRATKFHIDGRMGRVSRFIIGRHVDIIEFSNLSAAKVLKVQFEGVTWEQPINQSDPLMVGSNGVMTKSKNNKLKWITDWARYHVEEHGADAVVIADNGSTDYTLEQLDESLKAISGLKEVRVLNAAAIFGPTEEHCTKSSLATFLQVSLLNIALDRFFGVNAVMLNVDIDELVVSRKGQSVFDATRRSMLGHLTFEGKWIHSKLPISEAEHHDHFWAEQGSPVCPSKYTIASRSPFRRFQLQVHNIAHVDRNLFKSRNNFYFLHCKQISTSWKYDRNANSHQDLVFDPKINEHMKRVFPSSS